MSEIRSTTTSNDAAAEKSREGHQIDGPGIIRLITGNTFLVVDNSNVLRGGFGRGFRIDPALVLARLGGDRVILAAMSASAALHERPCQGAYYDWLRRTGWVVNEFELQRDPNGKVHENEEAVDGDVRSQIRAAAKSDFCDTVVLMSGDGGFTNAVREARRAGKNVIVLAWAGTLHPALAEAASAYADLDSLRDLIGREVH